MSAVDKVTLNLAEGVKGAGLIIVATPAAKVKEKIAQVSRYAGKGAIIIDVNSAKQDIMRAVTGIMPKGVHFVATHPMAGSENSGISWARGDLFHGSVCIITPDRFTNKEALKKVKNFWQALGTRVFLMSAKAHDEAVARVSHLPHALAYVLCDMVSRKELIMAGSGFRDATRIAKSDPGTWEEIFIQNRKSVLKAISLFEKGLCSIKNDMIREDRPGLSAMLKRAVRKRESID
jgi:prephenate dehydrogenase